MEEGQITGVLFCCYEGGGRGGDQFNKDKYKWRGFVQDRQADVCLPSDIDLRFLRVRFGRLLTLRYRFTVWEGTIQAFPYPPILFYGLGGYDSGFSLPSDIVLQFWRVRFRLFLTLYY
ncbi:hypothetical protein AZ46_0220065 [Metabacillus indicus LMG 22858]|nr:hypothetical protein AZ46_0220065 [Metabacillus indicus LMG 22858]